MPHLINYVDNSNGTYAHYNLLALLRHFCGGFGDLGAVAFSGTGDGTLDDLEASPDSVTETWTLTCTATAANGGTFSVTGSVSGAQANATVGVPYDNGLISFMLSDGATDFAVNDEFQFDVTQGAASAANAAWEILRYDDVSANRELILKGKGYSGTEEIFVGIQTYQNVAADYYNLLMAAFTGYVPGNSFAAQPGARFSGVPAHNQRIDYWLTLNPQRIAFVLKVGTPVYVPAYIGKALPYGLPSQFPYPVVCGGCFSGAATKRFSDTDFSGFIKGNSAAMGLRTPTGWAQPYCYPWGNNYIAGAGDDFQRLNLRDCAGVYQPIPIELHDNASNLWGALDGIYYISGFDNAVENEFTIGGEGYRVFQDVWRTGHVDYFAMRLDS